MTQLLPASSPAGPEHWLVPGRGWPGPAHSGFSVRTKAWIESCCAQRVVGFQAVWRGTKECAVPSWGRAASPSGPGFSLFYFWVGNTRSKMLRPYGGACGRTPVLPALPSLPEKPLEVAWALRRTRGPGPLTSWMAARCRSSVPAVFPWKSVWENVPYWNVRVWLALGAHARSRLCTDVTSSSRPRARTCALLLIFC